MTIEEFKETAAEKARDFARSCTISANESSVISDFVWFDVDENNKLTALTYLYTVNDGSDGFKVNITKCSGLNKIDLKGITLGRATLQYQNDILQSSTEGVFAYKSSGAYSALANSVYGIYTERYGASVYTPLLRLAKAGATVNDEFGIDAFDITESGYVHYHIRTSADENAAENELITTIESDDGITYHSSAEPKTFAGSLVYNNIKG